MRNINKTKSKVFRIAECVLFVAVFFTCVYLINNYFFTYDVLVNVLRGTALIAVLAMAQSIALAVGGIDLSLASISLLSSSIMFFLIETQTTGVVAAITAGIAAGGLMGLINGVFISRIGIQPVLATMATALFARGVSGAISGNIVIFDT